MRAALVVAAGFLACSILAELAHGQTLSVCVPDLSHASHGPMVARLGPMGWKGATLALEMPSDPAKLPDTSALESFLTAQLRAGRRVTVRLPGGVWPSRAWLALAGAQFDTPFIPPRSVWAAVGKIDGHYLAAIRRACAAAPAPLGAVTVELGVERGIGGVCGPQRGSWSKLSPLYDEFRAYWKLYLESADEAVWEDAKAKWLEVFPSWTWSGGPMPEGTIPAESTEFVRYRRFANSYSGFGQVAMTFEFSNEATARAELQSFLASPAGKSLYSACSFLGMNVYQDDARRYWDATRRVFRAATPIEAADRWAAKVERRAFWIRQYAELAGERLVVVESNIRDDRVPADVASYRQAMIVRAARLPVVESVGLFCGVATDGASLHNNLYTWGSSGLVPVGYEVGPAVTP